MDEDDELDDEEPEEDEDEEEGEGEEAGGDDDEEEPLFGRVEAAALLAVEAANGGELADLEQVIVAYYRLFHRWPDVDDFTFACQLLCEAGLTNYVSRCLGLDPRGRKLLRHSGLPRHSDRPLKVVQLMQDIDEGTLAEEGSLPEPNEEEVRAALEMVRGRPSLGAVTPPLEPRFLLPSPLGGAQFSFHESWADDSIPLVAPTEDDDDDDDEEDEETFDE
jgi:hypothetical protein